MNPVEVAAENVALRFVTRGRTDSSRRVATLAATALR